MVARMLNLSGLYLGKEDKLMVPAADNPEGFWEHIGFTAVSDEVLAALGGAWDLLPPTALGCEQGDIFSPILEKGRELGRQLESHGPWGWKDPRCSLILPFWMRAFDDLRTVICLRHPVEVCRSLTKRARNSQRFGLALWLEYNRRLLKAAPKEGRLITHYDSYFVDPRSELLRLLEFLGLEATEDRISKACSTVFSPLRHHRADDIGPDGGRTLREVAELYATMCEEAGPIYRSLACASFTKPPRDTPRPAAMKRDQAKDLTEPILLDEFDDDLICAVDEGVRPKLFRELKSLANTRIVDLKARINQKDAHIGDLQAGIRDAEARIDALRHEGSRLEEQIEQQNVNICNREGHVELLLESARELKRIHASHGWQALCAYYRVRDYLLPIRSKRRVVVKLFFRAVLRPLVFLSFLRPRYVLRFFRYLWHEDAAFLQLGANDAVSRALQPAPSIGIEDWTEGTQPRELIELPRFDKPLVSVVIPAHNKWEYTYRCLKSISENGDDVPFEVILGDDNSSDATRNVEDVVKNIIVSRNDNNVGFLKNCNATAKLARGKYLCFLNNDTQVRQGWLGSLVEVLERDESVGVVGSKLVYPDGRLQEAGGIIWSDASGWNYGKFDDPLKPEYCYLKETDYVSGASMLVRRELFEGLRGFDELFAPAYYEDTDLCFRVRRAGHRVILQPRSIVVHHEGISSGVDTRSGVKQYQAINREKFLKKHADVLESEHFRSDVSRDSVFHARDRSRGKPTVLVIDHYVPRFDQDAGSRSTFGYLKLLVEMGFNIKFMSANFFRHEPYTSELEQLGIEVLVGNWYSSNWQAWIEAHARHIDYAYLHRPRVAMEYVDVIREKTRAKIIYLGHELHYLSLTRRHQVEGDDRRLQESEELKRIEFELLHKSDAIATFSWGERELVLGAFPNKKVEVIPLLFFNEFREPVTDFSARRDIMFVGGFGHPPNKDAVFWFVEEVFPEVLEWLPDVRLYIVGSSPPVEVERLRSDNIVVTGFVSEDELGNLYDRRKLVILPLRYGAGVKGKLIESMYRGCPVVSTSIGIEGVPGLADVIPPRDTAQDFAEEIVKLYGNEDLLEDRSAREIDFIKARFTTDNAREACKTLFKT